MSNDVVSITMQLHWRRAFPLTSNTHPAKFSSPMVSILTKSQEPRMAIPMGSCPDSEELERRNQILAGAYEGIQKTRLAVYVVPASIHSVRDL